VLLQDMVVVTVVATATAVIVVTEDVEGAKEH
jgi:hypothetical protein